MDRSSKERSRFEKLDAAFVRLEIACQDVRDALDEFRETRAALEDRQEAAPEAPLARCALCGGTQFDHFQGGYDHNFMWPGVPSEATPSKENAPITWPCTGCGDSHAQGEGCFAAPVPEVQGTPTKEVMPQCHKCGGESPWGDVCAGCLVGQGKCDLHVGWHKQIENCVRWEPAAPVGTPQKETPTMPYGAGAQNFGAVPEGVQGKEPPHETPGPKQAPTEYQQVSRQIMARMRELHIPIPEGDCGPLQFFNAACASREAAGRRSAITELQERAKEAADMDIPSDRRIGFAQVDAWCAELQEKTK